MEESKKEIAGVLCIRERNKKIKSQPYKTLRQATQRRPHIPSDSLAIFGCVKKKMSEDKILNKSDEEKEATDTIRKSLIAATHSSRAATISLYLVT